MAFASSIHKGQIPIGCQLCEIADHRIEWKCKECDLLICKWCKETVYLKIGKGHLVVDIKDLGKHDQSLVEFGLVRRAEVETMNIHSIVVSSTDDSLWVRNGNPNEVLRLKLRENRADIVSRLKREVFEIDISPSGTVYVLLVGKFVLSILNPKTGQIHDSKYTIKPWTPVSIHFSRSNRIIVGGVKSVSGDSRGGVIVMDADGKHQNQYEEENGKPVIKYPDRIVTTNRNHNIFVVDRQANAVLMIDSQTGSFKRYNGISEIHTCSTDKPFVPRDIVVTPNDSLVITDNRLNLFHILDNECNLITYYDSKKIGIIRPYSLAMSASGNIFIGKKRWGNRRTEKFKSKSLRGFIFWLIVSTS